MKINILTLFPDFFTSPLESSILGKAQENQLVDFNVIDIRRFAADKHHTTDLPPYGGGPGMVMKVEPIDKTLQSLGVQKGQKNKKIILTSAKGGIFTQSKADKWSALSELTLICGHYEGVDERVAENLVDEEVRIGNYVLTGGEPASLVIADAVSRLIPEVLGNTDSLSNESHSEPGKLGYPQYTRPDEYREWSVPEVLLSGDHQKIKKWRQAQIKKADDIKDAE